MKRRAFVGSAVALGATMPFGSDLAGLWRLVGHDPGDIEAVRGDGSRVTLRAAAIKDFARSLEGRVLLASTDGYETARQVLNPAIDKRPALIAQPTTTEEIRRAVSFAAASQLLLAVKCGGHSFSGQSTCDGGMMIDLSRFRGVTVDPKARRAIVKGGSLLGQVDAASAPHGLYTPLGTVSHTGVGGLTTGGGFGRLARRFGLAVDNLRAVEVVTADGKVVRANETENPDLFWAVRGGGGNFGIVTAFEFQLHPMQPQVVAGTMSFPVARSVDAWQLFGEYSATAPEDLYFMIQTLYPPGGGDGVVNVEMCYSGPAGNADKAMAPFAKLGTPLADTRKTMDYVAAQKSTDMTDPRALSLYLKSGFCREIAPAVATEIQKSLSGHPARLAHVFAVTCGGAIGRVAQPATAFAHREANQSIMMAVGWKPGSDPAPHVGYARELWKVLEKFTDGFYVNDLADESAKQIDANYGGNLPRLVSAKKRYDPTNLFRLNANVKPG